MTIDINDFPYYRDNVLVKRFESFLSINPESQDAWVDITDPINWSPNNKIYWTGSIWKVKDGVFPRLTCVNDTFKNFWPYGYRFTFNGTSLITIRLSTSMLANFVYCNFISGQDYIIFFEKEEIYAFKTQYGLGQVIEFLANDPSSFEISKIEIRKIPFPQDLDWTQIWNIDTIDLVDYDFSGFSIMNDSPFMIGLKDTNLTYCSYSNGIWSSETITENPDIGDQSISFIYNNRKANLLFGVNNVGFSYQDEFLVWHFEIIPFTANPSPAINESSTALAFAPGNVYTAVSSLSIPPFVNILKRTGDSFATLPDPETLPTGSGYDVCWSRTNDTYLVVAHTATPHLTIYKRSGDTFTKLSDPSILPGGTATSCAFSPDDTYLAIGHSGGYFLNIYKRSGDIFTKLANPDVPPIYAVGEVEWSHSGTYLVCTFGDPPYFIIYKRSGDTFTKLTDPSIMPDGAGCAAFSHDDSYLFISFYSGSILYTRSGDTFTFSNALESIPYINSAKWSSDSVYLFMSGRIYKQVSGVFTLLNNNVDNLFGLSLLYTGKLDISDDNLYFGIGSQGCVHIYKRTGDFFNQISQGSRMEENTSASMTPFVDSNNNILILVDNQTTMRLYKRTPAGVWTREWFRGLLSLTSGSFWEGRELGVIDSSDKIHYAYFTIVEGDYQLNYLTWKDSIVIYENVDFFSVAEWEMTSSLSPDIVLQTNGRPIILYPTLTKTKLAIFNGATWDFTDFPITILETAKMIYKNGKLYIIEANTRFIIYNITTGLIEKSDFIYPEMKVVKMGIQNLEKTDFYTGIKYSTYNWIIYKRNF